MPRAVMTVNRFAAPAGRGRAGAARRRLAQGGGSAAGPSGRSGACQAAAHAPCGAAEKGERALAAHLDAMSPEGCRCRHVALPLTFARTLDETNINRERLLV